MAIETVWTMYPFDPGPLSVCSLDGEFEEMDSKLGTVLVLVAYAHGGLYYGINRLRSIFSYGQGVSGLVSIGADAPLNRNSHTNNSVQR